LAFSVPVGVLSTLDHRAEFDDQLHVLHDGVADPYATSRDFYLRRRQQEIDHIRGKEAQSPPTPPADAATHIDAVQTPSAQTLVAPGDRDRQTTKTGDGA
jgi:phospholipid-binding lipoprotein MlaA